MRKFFVALIAWALLGLAPAFAAITQIVGSGTGGTIGGNSFSGTGSLGVVTNTTIPPKSLVIFLATSGVATATAFAVSDTHGNTYTAPRAIDSVSGAYEQIFCSKTVSTINSGDTITVTLTGTTGALTGQVLAFAGASGCTADVATGNAAVAGTGALTVGPTATLACPGGAAGCEVLIGGEVLNGTARTVTNDSNFTATSPNGAGQNWISGFWIVGATTARSYAPSISGGSNNWAGQLVGFTAAPVCKRSLIGVGC